MTLRKDKKDLENTLDEIVKSISGSVKLLYGPNTNYGRYNRNAVGLFAAGYIALYCGHPITAIISIPLFAAGGYNFIQAFRHRNEILK